MKAIMRKAANSRGATLLEVLIAVAIMGFVTAAIFELYVTQHKHYIVQDDITNIQQNVRASIDELGRQIKMAGYDLPLGLPALKASNTNPDTITITYQIGNCETYLAAAMPQPSAELKCATDISCFYEGQWVYIFEPDSSIGEWFQITQVQEASMHLQHNTMQLSRRYGANALVLSMTQVKFYVDNTTNPDHPNLMLKIMGQTPQVYAEDVTNLQFQYRMKNGVVVDVPTVVDHVREVLIDVTGRSRRPDPDEPQNPYRQRTFSTSVFLRNVGV
ncbi:MAG TPA: prepilin-type N-terminal cleavage/methylation domain-containing protein [Candidatus Deferrimicrobium sp.]|nr:prepilin-type N-terminal cleavage/methylation domain-containing protein [Candidatus Deferrimicrobium sp.]